MKILIDADGCPVVKLTVNFAKQKNIKCVIVCDTSHVFEYEGVETITVSKGADSADFKIVNILDKGDIVVTQDYGLAAMCLARGAKVISQNGLIYSDRNIDGLLYKRHENKKVLRAGGHVKGPKKRTDEQNEFFIKALSMLLD